MMCTPGMLAAQSGQTGTLQGRTSIANGRVVANAVIDIRRADGSFSRTTRSSPEGTYRIDFITPGTYEVHVQLVGYRPLEYTDVAIRAAEVQQLDIVLTPSRTELETLRVNAGRMNIDLTSTAFSSSLQARERELLPTPRDANALIDFTPGARTGQIFGGSTDQANLYQLDGVTVNQPGSGGSFLLPNIDWIEDFQVIGLGAGAEYGNFQGGLVNIITKSGSNTLQTRLRTFYESRALSASNAEAGENASELDHRVEVNAEVRGPILRDRVYFYLSGSEARSGNRVLDLRANATGTDRWLVPLEERHEQKFYGKLTWAAGPRDMLNASLGVDNLSRERVGLSGFDAVDATLRGESPSLFYQANWQRTVNERNSWEVKLSGYSGEDNELPYNGSDFPGVRLLDAPNSPQYANAFYTSRNSPSSLGLNAAYNATMSAHGIDHQVKIGGELVLGAWNERRTRNSGLSWYTEAGADFDPLAPATWQEIPSLGVYATADTGGQINLNADTRNSAVYVQDYMRINDRLTLSAGLRLGLWQGFITPGFPGGTRGSTRFRAVNAQGLDPRLGAAYDLRGDGSLVAKAHWGRFHQNLFALFFDRAPGSNVFTNIGFCDWNDRDKSVLPELGRQYTPAEFNARFSCFPGSVLFNEARAFEDYEQPYMDQITLGLEKMFGTNLKGEVLYINRQNHSVLSLADRNLESNWSPLTDVQVRDVRGPVRTPDGANLVLPLLYVRNDDLAARLRAGDVIPGYVASDALRLRYDPYLVVRPVDEATRSFNQLQLALSGVYDRATFVASLAFTRLTGNVYSVNGYYNPAGQENGPFVERNGQLNFDGNLENYSPWEFKLRATSALPLGFEGGMFLSYLAGEYWAPSLTLSRQLELVVGEGASAVPLSDELFAGTAGQALFTEPRGSRQLDGVASVDLRLQKVFSVGSYDLIAGLEAFNLPNGDGITARHTELAGQDPSTPSSLVGAVRRRQAPATFRLNVQVRY